MTTIFSKENEMFILCIISIEGKVRSLIKFIFSIQEKKIIKWEHDIV
jgi:hypothetical protein